MLLSSVCSSMFYEQLEPRFAWLSSVAVRKSLETRAEPERSVLETSPFSHLIAVVASVGIPFVVVAPEGVRVNHG